MWYIGQKVVAIEGGQTLKKDTIYTIEHIVNCGNHETAFHVGINRPRPGTICSSCGHIYSWTKSYFNSRFFVPLSEYTANETAVDEMVKESVKNIYQK